jgi:hypothetical protein
MADDGTRVKKGDVLLRFDDTDERLRVSSNWPTSSKPITRCQGTCSAGGKLTDAG